MYVRECTDACQSGSVVPILQRGKLKHWEAGGTTYPRLHSESVVQLRIEIGLLIPCALLDPFEHDRLLMLTVMSFILRT